MVNDADVIVIGAGGGGAVAARELGEKGIKVLVLEAGAWYGNSKWPRPNSSPGEIGSSSPEDLSIDILKECFTDLEDDMNDFATGKFRWGPADRNKSTWGRNIINGGFTWQNAGVGGSTLHYFANCPRAFPQSVNNIWPLTYEELIPYYERVEQTLPVRQAPVTAKEELFFYGARKAGFQALNTPDLTGPGYRSQPNAILRTNPEINDPDFDFKTNHSVGCTLRGHCVNGCHIGPTVEGVAKRSTFASYIPRGLRTGNVEVRPNTFVIKILTEEDQVEGIRTIGVRYRNTWTGEIGELRSRVVVMAGGGIETPRLWLNSELPENEWVGRGLLNHWFDNVSAIFDEKVLMDTLGVPDIKPFVGQNAAARLDYPGLGVVQIYGMSPGLYSSLIYGTSEKGYHILNKTNTEVPWDIEGRVAGEQLKEFMREYPRTLSALIFTDDDVNQNNRVELDKEIKDENGYIPLIYYQPSESDKRKRDRLAVIASEIYRNAGARTIIRSNWPKGIFIHITSTMRIGYVTDTNCEAYQVKRLYIADNSVLYNGIGGPNPTLTTQALATRTSEKIAEKYFSQGS
jgi:choline dehydrogenase-like flavoprotein